MRKDLPWMHNNLKPPDVSLNSMVYGMSIPPPNPKKFLIFDHSGDRTSVIFNSVRYPFPSPIPSMINPIIENPQTNVPDGGEEEMCEDSEEIDALLYSDSDDDNLKEEEGSSGHSPIETMTMASSDDAASICSKSPAKRKRDDSSLADTASSIAGERDDESGDRTKRAKIQETVGVLRRIIPGGRGKGAAEVLDEAIQYLRSLKIKALKSVHSVATAS